MSELREAARAEAQRIGDFVLLRVAPAVLVMALVFNAAWLAALAAAAWAYGLMFTPRGRADCAAIASEARIAVASVARWNELQHARAVAAEDDAPAYWAAPAQNAEHAGYRAKWEELAKKSRSDAEDATLVQVLRGLKHYGDNPLTRPAVASRRLFGVLPTVGPLQFLPLYVIGALVVLLGVQSVRVDRLKADADRWHDNATAWQSRAVTAERNVGVEHNARVTAEQNALREEDHSLELANNRDALADAHARRDRSRAHEIETRTSASVVDYSGRLRELSTPPAVPADGSTTPGGDSPG